MKLGLEFYNRDALTVAKDLLGKVLVHKMGDKEIKARIVEVEAYTGIEDKASHTYGDKRTSRTETMYKRGGHLYVYLIYGMYSLMNVVTGNENSGEAVLIRALEPISELDMMATNRFNKPYSELTKYQARGLTNGPGKLTKAMGIDRSCDGIDLLNSEIHVEDDGFTDFETVETTRIGIGYAEEAREYPYRFYIKGNPHISIE